MTDGLFQLALVVALASVLGIVAKLLRQPTILAYVAAGVVIGWFNFFHLESQPLFSTLADLGITFLLFLVGMEINYTALRAVGKSSVLAGLGQVSFTGLIGFGLSRLLGFSILSSLYLAAGLAFSSTIIVVKLLSEKGTLRSLPGKLGLGILLVQDIIVILMLVVLAGLKDEGAVRVLPILSTLATAVLLFVFMLWLGRKIIPVIFEYIAHSRELLFLSSIAWCLLVAVAVAQAGFSLGIGGFLAGVALANSAERHQISGRVQALRDFFLVAFFAILGSSLVFLPLQGLGLPIIAFSLFVLVGNPLIVIGILGAMGHRRKTSFLVGLSVAQLSEFSLILGAMGVSLGHIPAEVLAILTACTIITIIFSTYFIEYDQSLFRIFGGLLKAFERAHPVQERLPGEDSNAPIVLIGGNRVGRIIASQIPKEKLLLVDYDPDIVRQMGESGYSVMFGDIGDEEVFRRSGISNARLVISTSPSLQDNMRLLEELGKNKGRARIVVRAETEREARSLYRAGADYVLLPHAAAGKVLSEHLARSTDRLSFIRLKNADLRLLAEK